MTGVIPAQVETCCFLLGQKGEVCVGTFQIVGLSIQYSTKDNILIIFKYSQPTEVDRFIQV